MPGYEDRELGNLCRMTILLRAICVGAALSAIAFLMATGLEFAGMMPVLALLVAVFPLSAFWWVLFKSGYNLKRLIYAQLLGDIAVEAGIVYLTGGVYSHLSVVFLVTIFAAGILLSMRVAVWMALLATVLLAAASAAREASIDAALGVTESHRAVVYVGLNVVLQAAFFFLVALLGGYVSRRVRTFGAALNTAATELRKVRMDTSLIIESMNSGLVTVDAEGSITEMNQAASRILGVDPVRVRGKNVHRVLGQVTPDMVAMMMRALQEGVEEKRAEVYAVNSGSRTPLGLSVSTMSDHDGRHTGAVSVFQDLTEVKSMEEKVRLADRLAALGELSAGMAHEIRTPLASICGSVEMLRDSLPREGEDRKLVDLVVKESERLRNIVDHFLHFARSRPARFARVPLRGVLDEVVCMVRNHPRFREGMALDLQVDDGVAIMADEENVKQVFYNLAVNAIEAMEATGRLEISVDPAVEENSKRFARVAFTDDGEGMDPEMQEQAFRPFYTGKKSGTGLGLPIVAKIIQEHGGSIEVRSTKGEGTVVSVLMPLDIETITAGYCEALPERSQITNGA